MLIICFLGKTKFEYEGKSILEQLGNKTAALICLLSLNQNKYLSREKIIAFLWPDSNEEAAKYNLRFNLWLIKKNIGLDSQGNQFLHVDKDCCGINEKYAYHCDLLDIINFRPSDEDSIDSLLKLRGRFAGDFLEGYYFNNCEELNEWILFERINFEKRKVKILKRLACLYEQYENFEACMDIIHEIHEIEPYDEEMALKIMQLYLLMSNRVGAINYYHIFSNKLATSLGILPSEQLKNLYNDIRSRSTEIEEVPNKVLSNIENSLSSHKHIHISVNCLNIDYFWMSEVTRQLLGQVEMTYLNELNKHYLFDLSYIQIELLENVPNIGGRNIYETSIPQVRIIQAFIQFMEHILSSYTISIENTSSKEIDSISAEIVNYLKKIELAGITIKCQ